MTYKLTLPEGKESNTFDIIIKVGENGNNDTYIPADPDKLHHVQETDPLMITGTQANSLRSLC